MHLPSVLVHIFQLHHVSSCCRCWHLSTTPRIVLLYLSTSLNNTTSLPVVRVHIYQLHHASSSILVHTSQHNVSSCCTCSHLSAKARLNLVNVFTSLNNTTALHAVRVHISQLYNVSTSCTCSHLSTTPRLFLLYVFKSLNYITSLPSIFVRNSQQHPIYFCCTFSHLSTTLRLFLL